MKVAANIVRTTLLSNGDVSTLAEGRVFWERGLDNEKLPMISFSIQEGIGYSKDRPAYTAIIRCYAKDMTETATLYEAAKLAMVNAAHSFRSGQTGIADDESREAVAELIVELNNI